MFLLRLQVNEFIEKASVLWQNLQEEFKLVHRISAGPAELNAWKNSLPALADVLMKTTDAVKSCSLFIEYGMPSSSCRADILLAGIDPSGHRAAIVIELKQWDAHSITIDGYNLRVGTQIHGHPCDQALGYRDYLADLSVAFADLPKTLKSCSYLHNLPSQFALQLSQDPFTKLTEISPLFAGNQKERMAQWISTNFAAPPDSRYIADLESDKVKVSKNLFDTVAKAVRDEPTWRLLDEQRVAYSQIVDLVHKGDQEQHLVLVTGGPGTGKSIIAMQLMGELNRQHISCVHITNSSSFTTVMKSLIQQKRNGVWGTKGKRRNNLIC
jgi:hypothetical protein